MSELTMDKLVSLCKGRGFIFAGSEIYGGLANTWDYGPLGVELKNNTPVTMPLSRTTAANRMFPATSSATSATHCSTNPI